MKLLSPSFTNTKMKSNDGRGYHSAILHLAPSTISGYNACPFASDGCKKACLNTAGRGRFDNVQAARIRKTKLYFENRQEFMRLLWDDLTLLTKQATKKGLLPAVRLNGTSDLPFWSIIQQFPHIQFYDYTKSIQRCGTLISQQAIGNFLNYHLTFSKSESNWHECLEALNLGIALAVVFTPQSHESMLNKPSVENGLEHDLRFLDKNPLIVALSAKGKAKQDESKFVVNL